jgi:F0F1-type ATP synthase membrane subunit b/b'
LNNQIKDLKAQVAKASEKAKAELNEMIKELDKKMAAAKQQLGKLKSASARTWEEAKSRTTAALDDLQKTYDRAVERIKKSV